MALRRLDEESRAAEERFRKRYEAINVGVTVLNKDGKIIYANNAAADILGMSQPS